MIVGTRQQFGSRLRMAEPCFSARTVNSQTTSAASSPTARSCRTRPCKKCGVSRKVRQRLSRWLMNATSLTISARAGANGIAVAQLPAFSIGETRTIQQVTVSSTSALETIASLVLNGQIITQSQAGNLDTAAGDPPVTVRHSDTLLVQWTGATQGSTCTAVFYYTSERAAK